MFEETEISWADPQRGARLRDAFYRARGIDPATRNWKRIDPVVRAELWHRWQLKTWLTEVFAAGRLDQHRVRRHGPSVN